MSTLAHALTDPGAAGIDPTTCHLLSPRSTADVLSCIEDGASAGQGLLVYWTGQCRLSADGSLLLALASPAGSGATEWLAAHELVQRMAESRSRDRLLILDTCLTPNPAQGGSPHPTSVRREVDRLGRAGVAVLSSVDTSPVAAAVSSHALSAFAQQLAFAFRTLPRVKTVALPDLHRLLSVSLHSNGYLRPTLRNAKGFQRPLVTLQHSGTPVHLPARWHATAVEQVLSRCALAVSGGPVRSTASSDPWTFHPSGDAGTVYRALLDSQCGFTSQNTELFATPPSRKRLSRAIESMGEQDRNMALLYFSGHGAVERSDEALDLSLSLGDGERVLASELVNDLRKVHAETVLMVLDICSASRAAPAPLPFSLPERRQGFSRMLVAWHNAVSGSRLPTPEGLLRASTANRYPVPLAHESAPLAASSSGSQWRFGFSGTVVRCLDESGPLETWLHLFRHNTSGSSVPGPEAFPPSLLSRHPKAELPQPQPDGARTRRASQVSDSSPPPQGGDTPPPVRPPYRRHRARLRVAEGALPLQVGQRLRVTFNYQPQGEGWTMRAEDATEADPVDITLRIGADTARVEPSIIHTHLTDDQGTPPEEFGVTPRSDAPVTLRIDVVRRADGAMIQRIERVLEVASGDGADH